MALRESKPPRPTRTRIVDATIHLLSSPRNKSTAIADIAKEAGVARGLIYYYFKSKKELLSEAGRRVAESLKSTAPTTDSRNRYKRLDDRPHIFSAYI
jgi:AcrR family transcriptional regulator